MSIKKLESSRVLIDIDALLDTRLGTIVSIANDRLEDIILSGYHTRKSDDFIGVDKDAFKERYANRDKEVLLNSIVTPMARLLEEFSKKTLKLLLSTPFQYQPEIVLNIYPYILTNEEIKVLVGVIKSYTENLADISVVYKCYDEITPKYLKDDIAIYVTYNYNEWLETHSVNENFKKTICPEVGLIGPSIYFDEVVDDNGEAFSAIEELASTVIALRLYPISNFSSVLGVRD